MHSHSRQCKRALTATFLAAAISITPAASAQAAQHVITPQDPNKATQDATRTRQQNIDSLRGAFSSDKAKQALESAHMNPQEVQNAVAGLNDQDLAQLAQRANNAQMDFAAGNMSDHDLLLILVVVAVVILIIVIAH
jgi:hypothetical protein